MSEYQPPASYNENSGRNRPFSREPRKPMAIKKPKTATGHEAFLKDIETSKAEISIDLLDDPNPVVGTIKHSDKYTVSVKCVRPDGTYQVYCVFKHAIRMFWTTPNKDEDKKVH